MLDGQRWRGAGLLAPMSAHLDTAAREWNRTAANLSNLVCKDVQHCKNHIWTHSCTAWGLRAGPSRLWHEKVQVFHSIGTFGVSQPSTQDDFLVTTLWLCQWILRPGNMARSLKRRPVQWSPAYSIAKIRVDPASAPWPAWNSHALSRIELTAQPCAACFRCICTTTSYNRRILFAIGQPEYQVITRNIKQLFGAQFCFRSLIFYIMYSCGHSW